MRFLQYIYWICTILLSAIFSYSAYMYFTNTDMIKGFFEQFNYPSYIVIPLAILKIFGVIIILYRPKSWLTDWAYAGFFFNLVLATTAHYFAGHNLVGFSLYGLLVLFPSYILGKKIRAQKA